MPERELWVLAGPPTPQCVAIHRQSPPQSIPLAWINVAIPRSLISTYGPVSLPTWVPAILKLPPVSVTLFPISWRAWASFLRGYRRSLLHHYWRGRHHLRLRVVYRILEGEDGIPRGVQYVLHHFDSLTLEYGAYFPLSILGGECSHCHFGPLEVRY